MELKEFSQRVLRVCWTLIVDAAGILFNMVVLFGAIFAMILAYNVYPEMLGEPLNALFLVLNIILKIIGVILIFMGVGVIMFLIAKIIEVIKKIEHEIKVRNSKQKKKSLKKIKKKLKKK